MPPPYQPITGERETLRAEGVFPYCAMMQVAAEDTHDNFVICRGFDTRIKKYINYDADDPDNKPGISVAKPYGNRHVGIYTIGQIFPAFLPLCWLDKDAGTSTYPLSQSQNPGCVEDLVGVPYYQGQPVSLTETLSPLYDHNAKAINWMLIGDEAISKVIEFTLTAAIVDAAASAEATVDAYYDGADPGSPVNVYNTHSAINYAPIGATGQAIWDDYRGRYQIVEGSAGVGRAVLWGRTQTQWQKNSGDPRVIIRQVTGWPGRTSATTSGANFWCYLPPTNNSDPNISGGVNIPYVLDQDGFAVCVGDYLDAKIGSVRQWVGAKADIPSGWGLMNGVANSAGNGGSGFAMVTVYDQYFALGTDVDPGGGNGAVGTSLDKSGVAGSNYVTIPAHSAASIAAILAAHDASGIAAHAADATGDGYAVVSGQTDYAATLLTSFNVTADAHEFLCIYVLEQDEYGGPGQTEVITCYIENHTITVNDPTHRHGIASLSDAGHTHPTPSLLHSGTLAHNVTGDLAHSSTACRPEFVNLMYIERLDNSI